MGRQKISFIVLGILLALSTYLLLSRRSGTYSKAIVEFAVKDTSHINSVEIRAGEERIILVRDGTGWRVNGSTPARSDRIRGLLVMLSKLEVTAPVSRSRTGEILSKLEASGKRVIISGIRTALKSYIFYHDPVEGDAGYMLLEGSETPFRMGVRGYSPKNLAAFYTMNERFWRENVIFQYLPEQIGMISLKNNLDKGKSFQLARDGSGSFELSTGIIPSVWYPPAPGPLNQYLGYFYQLKFDAYADPGKDVEDKFVNREVPDYVLEVTSTAGILTRLTCYPVFRLAPAGNKKMDMNIVYARIDDWEEMIILKYIEIDPLLKDPGYFQSE